MEQNKVILSITNPEMTIDEAVAKFRSLNLTSEAPEIVESFNLTTSELSTIASLFFAEVS